MTDKIKEKIFDKFKCRDYFDFSAYLVNEMLDFAIEETSKAKDEEFKAFVEKEIINFFTYHKFKFIKLNHYQRQEILNELLKKYQEENEK